MGQHRVTRSAVTPGKGVVTWNSEGTEGGKFHSRTLSVPSDNSGLTLGRGYDMRERLAADIVADLTAAGVLLADAMKISGAARLKGAAAKKFIADNKLEKFEISQLGQVILFERTYDDQADETQRRCSKKDVTATYGVCDWESLHPAIADMLVDLNYRGDYTGTARRLLQKYVVMNDLGGFAKALSDRNNWKNVPKDRFDRRATFIKAAVEAQVKSEKLTVKPMRLP